MESSASSLQKELERAHFEFYVIRKFIEYCGEKLDSLHKQYRCARPDWDVILTHGNRLGEHAAAIEGRLRSSEPASEAIPFSRADLQLRHVPHSSELLDHDEAYDQDKIRKLEVRDIEDALDFHTELKATFGIATSDEEVEVPLSAAMSKVLDELERGDASIPGLVVLALKAFMKAHPRGFGRYYTGNDPWPRPPAVVQAEIDTRMPEALQWLRYELSEALEAHAREKAKRPTCA
jgi:hypothetical protein